MRPRAPLLVLALAAVWMGGAGRVVVELQPARDPWRHHDFRTLAAHQELFYEGVYPHRGVETPPEEARFVDSVYPPYAFITAALWLPPGIGRNLREAWFTGCQLGALAILLGFAWRAGRALDRGLAWLLAGAVMAMTGFWADVLFGNFSALTCAPLVALYVARAEGRPFMAGIAWWLAMLKPQVGAMFSAFLLERRFRLGLVTGGALLGAATVAACAWTGVTPWQALSGAYLRGLMDMSADGHSLVTVAAWCGLPTRLAQPVLAIAGLVVIVLALRSRRAEAEPLAQFAAAALVARLCLYHRPCDDLLLVFAIAHFGRRAWQAGGGVAWVELASLGLSVWLPTRATEIGVVKAAIVLVWLWLLFRLLRAPSNGRGGDGASP